VGDVTDLPRLVVASSNPHKVAEIGLVLDGLAVLEPRPTGVPEVVEDGETLEANARLKAMAICKATGQSAVADDTGLEVDALGGAPGVHSARYAASNGSGVEGDAVANTTRLLYEMECIPVGRRTARFRTVALVRRPDGSELVATGTVEGYIAETPAGEGGFGYDPVFVPAEGDGRTFAEMGDEKHAISHRGRAFRDLARRLVGT
jgi:XTP/dITP diphosphohydrolase